MKVLLVDDDPIALQLLNQLLDQLGGVQVIGSHGHPGTALDQAKKTAFDAAFIDMEMPDMNGLYLAEMLLQEQPHLTIVFVTSHAGYAVEAFDMEAFDYIMKPVQRHRLEKTLLRIRAAFPLTVDERIAEEHEPGMLCSLQRFHFRQTKNGRLSTSFFAWRTIKAQELFYLLLHHREQWIRKEVILDLLWKEHAPEKAAMLLHTTIYQLRQLLKKMNIKLLIVFTRDGYRMDMNGVQLDVVHWEQALMQAPPVHADSIDEHKHLMMIYSCDYLNEISAVWLENERERLRLLWWNHIKEVAHYYLQTEQYTEAMVCYQQMQAKFPLSEDGYFGLMQIYGALRNYGEVERQFQLLSTCLHEEMQLTPSSSLIDYYEQWKVTR